MPENEKMYFETDCISEQVHIHSGMELLYILQGRCAVFVNGKNFVLKPEDLIVFNPFEEHQLYREMGGHVLSLYIPIRIVLEAGLGTITCISSLQPEKEASFDMLRGRLAEMYRDYTEASEHRRLNLYAELLELLSLLQQDFSSKDFTGEEKNPMKVKRAKQRQRLLSYIWEHYTEPITLKSTATDFYLSEGYFSRLFQEISGKNFSDYLRSVRLSQARQKLLASNISVTEVAFLCGFGNVNTFIEAFHREYGVTPGAFVQAKNREWKKPAGSKETVNTEKKQVSYMNLLRYRTSETRNNLLHLSGTDTIRADFKTHGKTFYPVWKKVASGGYARDLLFAVVQEAFSRSRREIDFDGVLIHGIFQDELGICRRREDGVLCFNYAYLDLILKFLVENLKVTPWLVLDYTPACLAGEENLHYFGEHVVNLPQNLNEWTYLVTETLKHMVALYGRTKVSSWKFSMEQAIQVTVGNCDMQAYQIFYRETYRAIKAVLPNTEVFGFGLDTGFIELEKNQELEELLTFAKENDCLPDLLSFQCFFCDYSRTANAEVDFNMTADEVYPLSENPDILSDELELIQKIQEKFQVSIPIFIMVANAGMWGRSPGNDTCFKAAFIARNVIKNRDKIAGYVTSGMIDYAESLLPVNSMYHGGFGMVTFNGVPKAAYRVMQLLSELSGNVIAEGENYILTRTVNGKEFYLLLYHYCFYNLERHRSVALSLEEEQNYDRYYEYEEKGAKSVRVFLRGLPPEAKCQLETHYVNREHGSSYDVWMKMGAPVNLNQQQLRYLDCRSGFEIEMETVTLSVDGELTLSFLLEPHEVRVIHGVLE